MNRKIIIEYLLPTVYRKSKWVALLMSLSAALDKIWGLAYITYTRSRRRAGCDGSVISLKYLIAQEFGLNVQFEDGQGGSRRYIKQRGESLGGAFLGSWHVYDYGETTSGSYDYIVRVPSGEPEILARIKSLLTYYNSAGYVFDVVGN